MKIAVMGYSGAGKSTLARALGERYHCPVLHLDQVQFLPGWQERDRGEALARVGAVLSRPSWVIDGNYRGLALEERLDRADRIVFLALPALTCLRQAVARFLRYRGRVRPDMAAGCMEKLDREFVWWVLWAGRTPASRRQYRSILARYPDKTIVLRSRRQTARFLEGSLC